jgi:hypothetical protein
MPPALSCVLIFIADLLCAFEIALAGPGVFSGNSADLDEKGYPIGETSIRSVRTWFGVADANENPPPALGRRENRRRMGGDATKRSDED